MAKIESAIGNRNFESNSGRNFVISDETENDINKFNISEEEEFDIQKQIQLDKEARKNKKFERMSDGAKRRIEILIGMTTLTKVVDVAGIKFTLKVLKSKDLRDVYLEASNKATKLEQLFEVRKQTIARALISIDDLTFEEFLSSDAIEDKLNFIDELDDAVATKLNSEYSILSKEADAKYGATTVDEAKGVIEDLKK